jgi:elongation factor Ts
MLDCKKALEATDGDVLRAIDWLREKGLAKAAKKSGRSAEEGLVECYVHPGNRVAVMVEVNCETDFVARSPEFKALVHEVMLQVAMSNPVSVDVDTLPAELVEKEKSIFRQRAIEEGKSSALADKVAEGRLSKFYQEACLLQQPYIKNEDITVRELLQQSIGKLGENIVVHRFARYELGN